MKVYRHTKNGMTTIGVRTWWGAKRIIYQYAMDAEENNLVIPKNWKQ